MQARNALQSDMLIIARTDARQTYGFDEAHQRLKDAVDIGVDVVFLEALQSKEECQKICELMGNVPVLLNSVPGGVTPDLSMEEASAFGFKIMIYPGLCLGPIIQSVSSELQQLKESGRPSQGNEAGHIKAAFNLCGLQECLEVDSSCGGKAYATVGE